MPILGLNELRHLNAAEPYVCPRCSHAVRRNYCRECDVTFEAGHQGTDCRSEHDSHRTY